MARDDWYRRTSWTESDAEAFHERNRRSRGVSNKVQYLRIQAETLLTEASPPLPQEALDLLNLALESSSETLHHAPVLDCAGRCLHALGRASEAMEHFFAALQCQRTHPGIQTNACFHLGRLVAEQRATEHYDVCLEALEEFGAPVFPWHAYMTNGIRAHIAAARGDQVLACEFARAALEAAEVSDSGLDWGRDHLGLVHDTNDLFHARIGRLAAA